MPGFKFPPMNGVVNDIALAGGRLFIGGTFTTLGPNSRPGLGTLNPTTGAVDAYMTIAVAGHHNYPHFDATGKPVGAQAPVGVSKLDVTPDGSRMVDHRQLPHRRRARPRPGRADQPGCDQRHRRPELADRALHRRLRLALVRQLHPRRGLRAGRHVLRDRRDRRPGQPARSATPRPAGRPAAPAPALQPTWVDYTGGDTLLSVAVTGAAVYVGGHERWLNNASARDRARPGAVPRPGVAALDPANGVPFSWNPGRNPRGAGAYAVYATPTGLWVGSDTDWIGNFQYKRGKMAFFPLAGGSTIPANFTGRLPSNVVIGSPTGATTTAISRPYDGTTAGANTTLPSSGLDWSTVRGAVMVDGKVFYGLATDSNFYWRTFDGTSFGPANLINPYQDPAWSTVDTGSGQTYIGVKSNFYAEIPNVTSMFFSGGRLYYTLSTSTSLFYRYFTPESGILGADKFTVAGTTNWSDTGGAFLDGTNLYLTSRSTGTLRRISWVNGVPGTTSTTVSGPAVDGKDWRGKAVFLSTVAANVPPTAAFTASCGGLSCTAGRHRVDRPGRQHRLVRLELRRRDDRHRGDRDARLRGGRDVHDHADRDRQPRRDRDDHPVGDGLGADDGDRVPRRGQLQRQRHHVDGDRAGGGAGR